MKKLLLTLALCPFFGATYTQAKPIDMEIDACMGIYCHLTREERLRRECMTGIRNDEACKDLPEFT